MNNKSLKDICGYVYKKVILPACFLYTIFGFIMMSVSDLNAIKSDKAMLVLVFSFGVALSNCIFSMKNVSILMRAAFHFVAMITDFTVVLLYGSGMLSTRFSGALLVLIVFIVLYLLIAPVVIYFIYKKEKKDAPKQAYKSIYSHH